MRNLAPVRGTKGRSFVPARCEGVCQSYTLIAGECWELGDKLTGCSFVPLRNLWSGHNSVPISCKRAAEQKSAQAPPIRSRVLRGHYEGTKSRLGHYRGQQISTGENGKSAGNALVSALLKRNEKAHCATHNPKVVSSNLAPATKTKRTFKQVEVIGKEEMITHLPECSIFYILFLDFCQAL